MDPFSSADQFTGWSERSAQSGQAVTREARTWLLRIGWRRRGLLRVAEIPAS